MNWLAFDARAYAAALFGCVLALITTVHVGPLDGAAPWLAGLLAGLACATVARDRSGPRGLVIAVMAVWTAALDAASRSELPLLPAILELHATLDLPTIATYALGFALAFALARTSLRRGAGERVIGA